MPPQRLQFSQTPAPSQTQTQPNHTPFKPLRTKAMQTPRVAITKPIASSVTSTTGVKSHASTARSQGPRPTTASSATATFKALGQRSQGASVRTSATSTNPVDISNTNSSNGTGTSSSSYQGSSSGVGQKTPKVLRKVTEFRDV